MDPVASFNLQPEDYRNRNSIVLHREDYTEKDLDEKYKSILYYWFSTAHGIVTHYQLQTTADFGSEYIPQTPSKSASTVVLHE